MTEEEEEQQPQKISFEEVFRRVSLSQNAFAREARVDQSVVKAARSGKSIYEPSAIKLTNALNRLLNTQYRYEDIDFNVQRTQQLE